MTESKHSIRAAEENPYSSPLGESRSWRKLTRIGWWIGVFFPVGFYSFLLTMTVVGSPGLQQLANSWHSAAVLYASAALAWLASIHGANTYRDAAVWSIAGTVITLTLGLAVYVVYCSIVFAAIVMG